MNEVEELGVSRQFDVVKVRHDRPANDIVSIATEIPLTITANEIEIATLMCTPSNLKELVYGFLFTSGFINGEEEVRHYQIDRQKWLVWVELARTPDTALTARRLYTTGCGKGVLYSNIIELYSRHPLTDQFRVAAARIVGVTSWLQTCSVLHKATSGVHTAAISINGDVPCISMDDVGRHNAVDKVIGKWLIEKADFARAILASTGRTSSDILYKAKRCGIPVTLSRGAPTHQTILFARQVRVTAIGFARVSGFTIYSHPERIVTTKE